MPATPSRADLNAVADGSPDPAVNMTPAPIRVERRLFSRPVGEKLTQFTDRLKTNARWIKQFLHSGV